MWLHTLRRYFGAILLGNLVWEVAQLPLYTIWKTGTVRDLAIAVIHCTAGDVAISASALVIALFVAGHEIWPRSRFRAVAGSTVAIGIAYTIYSERTNVLMLRNWGLRRPDAGASLARRGLVAPAAMAPRPRRGIRLGANSVAAEILPRSVRKGGHFGADLSLCT